QQHQTCQWEQLWKKVGKPPIGIPELRKPRGRQRTRDRKKEPFEALANAGKATRHGRVPKCSRCHQTGHIKSGCKNEKVGTPKPPLTRRRKTPTTGSSSQALHTSSEPVHASESSSQIPTHSTAPQPLVLSSDPKPHAKKASKGRFLKVRKTTSIPHGVGTLWCPFTNRPFEVFGDRVYDRSDLNPQQSPPPPPQE
ncbi:hypothetical protein HID58_055276, partial [Brassica napus]